MDKELDFVVICYGKVKLLKYDLVFFFWGVIELYNLYLFYLIDCILSYDIVLDVVKLVKIYYGICCMVMFYVIVGL